MTSCLLLMYTVGICRTLGYSATRTVLLWAHGPGALGSDSASTIENWGAQSMLSCTLMFFMFGTTQQSSALWDNAQWGASCPESLSLSEVEKTELGVPDNSPQGGLGKRMVGWGCAVSVTQTPLSVPPQIPAVSSLRGHLLPVAFLELSSMFHQDKDRCKILVAPRIKSNSWSHPLGSKFYSQLLSLWPLSQVKSHKKKLNYFCSHL